MEGQEKSTDSYTTKAILGISEYLEYIEGLVHPGTTLFRGQQDDHPLLPKLGRNRVKLGSMSSTKSIDDKEQLIVDEFRKRSVSYLDKPSTNDWELLAIAQHHGLPTRLLDWSTNPLVALWFTVKGGKGHDRKKEYGVVWAYEVGEGDVVDDSDISLSPFSLGRTKVYSPSHISPRITAQHSVFTVHKYISLHDWFYQFESNAREKVKLHKIKVYADYFGDIRKALDIYGINESSMFPDLDGLSKYIEWKSDAT